MTDDGDAHISEKVEILMTDFDMSFGHKKLTKVGSNKRIFEIQSYDISYHQNGKSLFSIQFKFKYELKTFESKQQFDETGCR